MYFSRLLTSKRVKGVQFRYGTSEAGSRDRQGKLHPNRDKLTVNIRTDRLGRLDFL